MKKKGLAEAEAMTEKAQAWEKYNQAAVLEMYLKTLPDLAKAVAEPLSKVDKIVIIGGGEKSLGTTKITAQVAEVLAQMPDVVALPHRGRHQEVSPGQVLALKMKKEE